MTVSNSHGNVVFNFRRDVVGDLAAFAAGYNSAAKRLTEQIAVSSGYRDYEGYPIFFLYRHSLELYLKTIVCAGARIVGLIESTWKCPPGLFSNHRLSTLLPSVKQIFTTVGWQFESDIPGARNFREFESLIDSIEEIDKNSYAFRYPINKELEPIMPKHLVVNVIEFGNLLDPILALLESAVVGLQGEFDAAVESLTEVNRLLELWRRDCDEI